ncbi:transposase [Burkholderia ubonensis]|nr:transposase [Burkholderia ubonensis]
MPVPNYTTLCRRAQTLAVQLPILRDGAPIHQVVDSTGVKVCGEGEWKVRQHGDSKRRTWRKVHIALDQIPADERLGTVGGDGAYDSKSCHAAIAARGATPSIPPRDGAVHWKASAPGAAWRNEAVDTIARVGRREWKKGCGY